MLSSKFLKQLSVLVILFFAAGGFASAQKNDVENNAVLAKFEKSIELGDYQTVERELLDFAIANQNNGKGFELMGRLRLAQNRLNEAKSLFQKALSLDLDLASAKINLALIYFQTGDAERAILMLKEISDTSLSNEPFKLEFARALVIVGDCQKALGVIEKLDINVRNATALPLRAECFLQSGEKQKAISLIAPAKKLSKQNPDIVIKFAEVLTAAALHNESADVLRSVVSMNPQNVGALVLLAQSEIYTRDFTGAKIHLNQAAKINSNSPNLFFVTGLLESERGNTVQAFDLLEKALAANPESIIVLKQFVVTAMRAGHAGKALKAAENLLELKPDAPDFLYLHGAAALQNSNLQTAENSLTKFLELRPQDARGCLALGLTFAAQTGKIEAARKQLNHCIETNPNNFEAIYQLGLSYKTQGETAKAIEFLEAAIKLSPEYAMALRDLGAVYLQSGAEAKARAVLEKSAALDPNNADTHFQLSRLYNLTGETERAKKHLEMFQKLRNSSNN